MAEHGHGDFSQHEHEDMVTDHGGKRERPTLEQRADQANPTASTEREESHEYDPNADGGPTNPSNPNDYPDPQKQGPETSRDEPDLTESHDPYAERDDPR